MTAMQQILNFLPSLEEGYSLELYLNNTSDAVIVIISPSSLEHHIDIDITDLSLTDLSQLEYYGVDICIGENHLEPRSDMSTNQSDMYANTNSFDERFIA